MLTRWYRRQSGGPAAAGEAFSPLSVRGRPGYNRPLNDNLVNRMSLAIDGKPAKTTWARGDAQFIGRGVPHEAKNTSGKPVDFVVVAIK